jgi:hypothetical protein
LTVNEAISLATQSCPHTLERDKLILWLGGIEERIATELTHREPLSVGEQDGEKTLTAPDAYAQLYPAYLMMMRELECADSDRYTFYCSAFCGEYERYARHVIRSRLAQSEPIRLI